MLRPSALVVVTLLLASTWAHGQNPTEAVPAANPDSALFIGFRAGYSNYTMAGTEVDLRTQSGGDQLVPVPWFAIAFTRKSLAKVSYSMCAKAVTLPAKYSPAKPTTP